ncbi:MAG: ABC transporter permease [Ktedonobacterales bacterium]
MTTIISLYRAALKEFFRDRAAIFWTLAFPIVFIVLFGAIFSGGGSANYTIGIVNQDGGQVGNALMSEFKSIKAFTVKTGTFDNEMSNLKKGQLDLMLVIPSGLSGTVASGQTAGVQMYYDPSQNSTNAQIEQTIVQRVVDGFNMGYTHAQDAVSLQTNTITAHNLSTIDFLMPGILAMSLMQLGLFGTAQPLVALRTEGVLRRLGATPLPRWHLLVSQVLLRVTIGMIQTVLIVGLSVEAFHVQMQGNWPALIGLVLLGAIMFVGMGYLIASFSKTVETAGGISSAVNFPMMFLSGIFFPLAFLPAFLAPIVRAMPLTYLADAIRQVSIGSVPDFPITLDIAVLLAWTLVCGLLSARFFKWE